MSVTNIMYSYYVFSQCSQISPQSVNFSISFFELLLNLGILSIMHLCLDLYQ